MRALLAVACTVLLFGCASTHDMHLDGGMHGTPIRAVAVLTPTADSTAFGTVTFEQRGDAVIVTADVQGLAPGSKHAWHIHEYGDIRGADGTATGGHYNPGGHKHGLPADPDRHAGDFGNLAADSSGIARRVLTVRNITIAGPKNAIIGRGLIVHAKLDDGGQPTGNAGARIAQGVIGVAKE